MQSTTIQLQNIRNKNLLKINKIDILLFLTGAISLIHTLTILSQFVIGLMMGGIVCFALIMYLGRRGVKLDTPICLFLIWYGVFAVYVCISILYTVNIINPSYVILRVVTAFALGLVVSMYVRDEHAFEVFAYGIILGGIIVSILTLFIEGSTFGRLRTGSISVGSGPTFGAIIMVAFVCSVWRIMRKKERRSLFIVIAIFLYTMIVLSGSRRIIILCPLFLLITVMLNRNIKKSKKMLFMMLALSVSVLALYIVMTNETFYNLAGWRIESMINSFFSSSGTITDASMRERNIMKEYAMFLFNERPLFGYGVHGFAYMFKFYYGNMVYSHCGFTEILSCYGVVGFVIFYSIFMIIFKNIGKRLLNSELYIQILLLFSIFALMTEFYTIIFLTPYNIVMLTATLATRDK